MSKQTSSYKSLLGRVRGLGSAKSGTHHWYMQRVTAIAIFLLWMFFIGAFIAQSAFGGYYDAHNALRSPWTATAVILFLGVAFHHANAGLQVVIEDYVHSEGVKTASLIIIKFACVALAVLGTLATLKVLFGA